MTSPDADDKPQSKWRQKYRVHPAADVFPMMSDEELDKLGADIVENGLRFPIVVKDGLLIDGRNRLEAMERAGIDLERAGLTGSHRWSADLDVYLGDDPVAYIISANIRRRHLTQQERLDLIVAARMAANKPGHDDPVSKGGRGKVNPLKAAVIADAKAAGLDASERTIKRHIAKAEGRTPKPTTWQRAPVMSGLDAARRAYLDWCERLDADLDAEQKIIFDAFREMAGKRAA